MMRKPRLQHVSLPMPPGGQQKVRDFYGKILGLQEKPLPHTLAHLDLIWFDAGDETMELHFIADPISPNQAESRHVCIEIDDLESLRKQLIADGYHPEDGSPIPNRPRIFCRDPFGNLLEFTRLLNEDI